MVRSCRDRRILNSTILYSITLHYTLLYYTVSDEVDTSLLAVDEVSEIGLTHRQRLGEGGYCSGHDEDDDEYICNGNDT